MKEKKCYICFQQFYKPDVGRTSEVCPDCYIFYRRATCIFYAAKQRSVKKNLEFDLDLDWIFQRLKQPCSVTQLPFEWHNKSKNYNDRHPLTPSIDRINSSKGYTKDNCRLVIWWFNASKQKLRDVDVWHLCEKVVSFLDVNNVLDVRK